MSVKRLFIEKKTGFDVEARGCAADLRESLGLKGLERVRLLVRYDVEGMAEEELRRAIDVVFSEPPVDTVYEDSFDCKDTVFAVEYLPGQYDQRADSAAQCVQLLTGGARPKVRSAKVYALVGELSQEEIARAKHYIINAVDSREAALSIPATLDDALADPPDVPVVVGFNALDEAALKEYIANNGLAMSIGDIAFTQRYFRDTEHREPTLTEIKVIDTYWSDHCRHTTFGTRLKNVEFAEGYGNLYTKLLFDEYMQSRRFVYGDREKDLSLMDMATLYPKELKKRGKLPKLDVSEEINACSFKCDVETSEGAVPYYIMFKNETHNHPTEIEPFGGAATCLGGAIRDPLSGRSYVYQAMRVTGCADPRVPVEKTLPGKLPQRKLTREAARGYSSYGNQIGLATGQVTELYHPNYVAKRMEVGAVVGAAPQENVVRICPQKGDRVVLVGGRTGRDGIGGATGSSKAHDEKSTITCGAEVQKGNPLTERNLQRLFRRPEFSRLVKRCNDFGAGGVSVAVGELADSLDIYLDAVPKKYEGLDGTELAISESQERMAVVVAPEELEKLLALAAAENLEATVIADVTDTGRMRMFWRDRAIVDIERDFLATNGVTQETEVVVTEPYLTGLFDEFYSYDFSETATELLSDLNVCSQRGLTEMFDSTIGASTVLMPLGGRAQLTPAQVMAAKVPVSQGESRTATLMAFGCDPYLLSQSPLHGAVYSIVSAITKLTAAGGDYREAWLSLQEFFESLGNDPERWGKPFAALLGAWYAQKELELPAIGGKDSMSGSFRDIDVPPTLCAFAICPTDVAGIISPELKKAGNKLYLLEATMNEFKLPDFTTLRLKLESVHRLIGEKKIVSAWAVERGGALAGICKMALGNGLGAKLTDSVALKQLTKKRYGSIVVEATCELPEGAGFTYLGEVTDTPRIEYGEREHVTLKELSRAFRAPLERTFPTKTAQKGEAEGTPAAPRRDYKPATLHIAKPKVVVPVFPGTNCEVDSRRAFERAGAAVETVLITNLTAADVEDSVKRLTRAIADAQIIMLPGGFSGGDEPDGSGKFIATVFRNPFITEAVRELLKNRDGLMLGICNGFQALIKLGLLPYGDIRELAEDSPTLTFNTIGRHVSRLVTTTVSSVNSPWLSRMEAGEQHTVAVSHGEGRFVATEEELKALFANGQVAFRYCDENGAPSMDTAHNPNGSMGAVEGLISADGRILGKMGHAERYTENTLINVPGNKTQNIFAGGVEYYK